MREWWIYSRGPGFEPKICNQKLDSKETEFGLRYYVPSTDIWTAFKSEIHVVEKSAYDAIVKERDELRDLVDLLSYRGPSEYSKVKMELDEALARIAKLEAEVTHWKEIADLYYRVSETRAKAVVQACETVAQKADKYDDAVVKIQRLEKALASACKIAGLEIDDVLDRGEE